MNSQLVEIYLEAENDIKNSNYMEAFRKYESILFEDPANAATHNSLGWIYKSQMDNYEMAEKHYQAAVNSDPSYPHAYLNYAILLMDMERYADLRLLLEEAQDVPAIEKSWIFQRLGFASELQLRFEEAMEYYEKAMMLSLNTDKIKMYREDLERCREKISTILNYPGWTGRL